MKKLLLLLLLPIGGLFAQQGLPNCVIPINLTTTGTTSPSSCGTPNGGANGNGIASWILVYYVSGFSGVSIVVQSAPDNAGVPGSWGTFAGTVLTNAQYPGSSGVNPNTAITSAFTGFAGYYPWMRVNLTSITGTGTVKGALYGFYNSTLAKAGSGGGGGGGGPTIAGTANEITVTGAGCTSPSTATCTISIPSGAIFPGNPSTPGTFTSGVGSGVTGAFDMVGATSGATSTLTIDATNTATTVKLPNDASSGLYAVTSPTATPAAGCAQFSGTSTEATSTGVGCGAPSASGGATNGYSAPAVTLPAAGTTFIPPVGGALPSSTEANVQWIAPVTATLSDLGVVLSAVPGTGNSISFTFRDGGSSQTVTCTIGAAVKSCTDLTHSFSVTQGDLLSILITTTGIVAIAPTITVGYEYGGGGSGGAVSSVGGLTGAVPGGWILLESHTASGSAALAFTTCIGSSYDEYKIEVVSIVLGSATTFGLRFSTNGGASYDSGSNYSWSSQFATCCSAANGFFGTANDNQIYLRSPTATPDLSGNYPIQGSYTLYDPLGGAFKFFQGLGFAKAAADPAGPTFISINGAYLVNTAVNAFEFLPGTGTVTSGTIRCYGAAKQ